MSQIGIFDGISDHWIGSQKNDGFRFNQNHHVAVGTIQLAVSGKHGIHNIWLKHEKKLLALETTTDLPVIWPEVTGDLEADACIRFEIRRSVARKPTLQPNFFDIIGLQNERLSLIEKNKHKNQVYPSARILTQECCSYWSDTPAL